LIRFNCVLLASGTAVAAAAEEQAPELQVRMGIGEHV
jgi:hypothetical protein